MINLGETKWEKPDINTVIAIGAIQLKGKSNKMNAIRQRRLKTVISETIWTIWKMRNKEIFEESKLNRLAWTNEWKRNMEDRITLEYNSTKGTNIPHWKNKLEKFMETWGKDETIISIRNGNLKIQLP